jgi:hypothetical protein
MSPPFSGSKNQERNQHETGSKHRLAGFMLGLLFDPEEEGDMFLRNIGLLYKKLMLNHILIQLNPVLSISNYF